MNDTEYRTIVINAEPAPVERKSTLWDWIRYYLYNWMRKPRVIAKQKELENIWRSVRLDMALTLHPKLLANSTHCPDCQKALAILYSQKYLSMIERYLRFMPCESHAEDYAVFVKAHGPDFKRSEEISRWINGFG